MLKTALERSRGLARRLKREITLYQAPWCDERTPRAARWILGLAVAYALSPIDLIPAFVPILGYLDDALVLPLLIWAALRFVPRVLVEEHRAKLEQT